ncbi:helix-turn-helix domain-containing protein [Nonomuraea sp. H19]|uniref:helix-turn-helix domain-containing protein n=1 Tax=Nonomuraea sp. H19 TaxID=3452206 RepID=UPI003F8C218A
MQVRKNGRIVESVRELAVSTGRSSGFVHRLLVEAGALLRARGRARRVSCAWAISASRDSFCSLIACWTFQVAGEFVRRLLELFGARGELCDRGARREPLSCSRTAPDDEDRHRSRHEGNHYHDGCAYPRSAVR